MVESDLRPFAFVLAVQDIETMAAYFQDAPGFDLQWAEASDWRLLSREGQHGARADQTMGSPGLPERQVRNDPRQRRSQGGTG
jgi:hypothetical protein